MVQRHAEVIAKVSHEIAKTPKRVRFAVISGKEAAIPLAIVGVFARGENVISARNMSVKTRQKARADEAHIGAINSFMP